MPTLPNALLAARLLTMARTEGRNGMTVIVASQHRAELLARLVREMDEGRPAVFLPEWDCLPYDRAAPSAEVMGLRMRALHALGRVPDTILVTTPEAVLQRLPVAGRASRGIRLVEGQAINLSQIQHLLLRLGYTHADRVEEPGQMACRGEVVDVFPAGPKPCRIEVANHKVSALHRFDPVSQRSLRGVEAVRLDAVSEIIAPADEILERFPGMEHWLPRHVADLQTVFTLRPEARIVAEPGLQARVDVLFGQIDEAYRDRVAADKHDPDARSALRADALYLTKPEWQSGTAEGQCLDFPGEMPSVAVPSFFAEDKPGKSAAAFIKERQDKGDRIILAAGRPREIETLAKETQRLTRRKPARADNWDEALAAEPGSLTIVRLSADRGFVDEALGTTLIAASDLLGHYMRASAYQAAHLPWHTGDGEFTLDDVVIHTDHGVGILRGLEQVAAGSGRRDVVRINYADGADLLLPVEDMHKLWRYGTADDGVAPDRLDGEGWFKRRDKIMAGMAETAWSLIDLAKARDDAKAVRLVPPRARYDAFVDGFRFAPTPDQMHAIDDVLKDLAGGRPMDRLVIGDVGFGKTEVALRAAAAAVLAGRQVAVVAPTTVLVGQHVANFRRRFEPLGIEVGHLSRMVTGAEAKRVRQGLADGSIRIAVGTHALIGKDVGFADFGLLIVDEEQRFGTAHKARLREVATGVHVLTMSATPIPRTLQSALVGLQDLSVIATPPARRRPIRTLVAPFDTATMRSALLREKARGGQSFVVMPRIEDLEAFADKLKALVPELGILVGHGGMDPQAVDEVMVSFAEGRGDVLLATTIVESGLDVPKANTMLVCDAERFGLAQLHQLRGRVGRGRMQGICYLMTDAEKPLSHAGRHRLQTLSLYDRLGSGLAISARDLDVRGGGDLVGDEQAGHMRLIGLGLYQHLLQLAIRSARGEEAEDWMPEIGMDTNGSLPETYIPEPSLRINLYARLARADAPHQVDEIAAEIHDRFGPLPDAVETLLDVMRLRALCRMAGIARLDAGPKAIALTPRTGTGVADILQYLPDRMRDRISGKQDRLIYACDPKEARSGLEASLHLLEAVLAPLHDHQPAVPAEAG